MPPKRSNPQHRVTKRARATKTPKAPPPKPQPNTNDNNTSPVYFWRETDPSTGYLSQWYPCAFSDDTDPSIIYQTAEHYMMYQKALLFSDPAVATQILAAAHPREVKDLGRQVSNFSDTVWHAHREEIVRKGSVLKFTRPVDVDDGRWIVHTEGGAEGVSIKELLLGTGEREIVEASPRDRIWGIGFGAARAGGVRERWGLNLLGKALMVVRGKLRKGGEGGVDAKEGGEGEEKGEEEKA
ncbi:hypothetical protein C8A01DRAFT_33534 [Parachaetomium inaequale]|uniref:NADAR domain-containing protein n=1 Tax=Parachaetomium inaequale TaxID=2588326 RepID=A0AAN6PKA9_9PEZI|nr:hypothetical protein C8A01DRAFT_33534 [Parachaetomium inaequale]